MDDYIDSDDSRNKGSEEEYDEEESDECEDIDVPHYKFLKKLKDLAISDENPFRDLDERRKYIFEAFCKKVKTSEKSVAQAAEDRKTDVIEKQLEDSEKQLNNLINFGNELVTNIKIANEKRELLRREFEYERKEDMHEEVKKESISAMARFEDITSRWFELENHNEPMSMYENLEKQKERIADLMANKDELIARCQEEINRINRKYDADQKRQAADISTLIERVDNQIELMKSAYHSHMEILQKTIDDERINITTELTNKWNSYYSEISNKEEEKFTIARNKQIFYSSEIERICTQQEEITRSTRIRLEKDAEILEWELQNTKYNVLMNSEKLDYNYQVLQKRNEENVIINNQQKRRVARVTEMISTLRKKILLQNINTENVLARLTEDIKKLHSSISELSQKSDQFKISNKKKFDKVWEINLREIKKLVTKVFEIDKILHEQQLAIEWLKPECDFTDINDYSMPDLTGTVTEKKVAAKRREQEARETRLLRNILRRIADRGGFLLEQRLLKILEPFTEEEQCLVRVDNIFASLRITDLEQVLSLTKYFCPYAYCPNCMDGVKIEALQDIYTTNVRAHSLVDGEGVIQKPDTVGDDVYKFPENPKCKDHYFVVEPTLVLSALNDFTAAQFRKLSTPKTKMGDDISDQINLIKLENNVITHFWHKFMYYLPEEEEKLWKSLEHGLNHYVEVLKQRTSLDNECSFLRKQNKELQFLLQKLVG